MVQRRKKQAAGGNSSSSELSSTLAQVDKRYGANSVRKATHVHQPDRISTGSFSLDFALLGGIPVSRGTMYVGEKHAGKSTMACKAIVSAQEQFPDQVPVVLDAEGTFDSVWAAKLGVDLERLYIVDCETGEMAVDVGDAIVQSQETSLLVVDSIAAMAPVKEVENSIEDQHVGLQARLISSFVRRLTSSFIKERKRGHMATVLYINQFRTKIGGYGDPRTVPGGRALEFGASVQVIIKNKENRGKDVDGVEEMTFNEHSFTITKNKLNPGPRTGEFLLMRRNEEENSLEEGDIDDAASALLMAKRFGLYTGAGSSWTLDFQDVRMKFGKAAEAVSALREDDNLYWGLRTYLIQTQAVRLGMPEEFVERIATFF